VLLQQRRVAGLPSQAQRQPLRTNRRDLVMQAVMGEITNPVGRANAYRIGNDGVPRVLPGPGGIVINRRIGDPCVGFAEDHVEPGVALRSPARGPGAPDGPNPALMTSACIGNVARVVTGPRRGARGIVTGKHAGVDHVLVDFDTRTLCNLNIGDRIQIYSCGLGLQLLDYPDITVLNCSPGLLRRWNPTPRGRMLEVRVTHLVPAAILGSGLGVNTALRGDVDLELFDPAVRRRFGLATLRFGDFVCVGGADSRFGFSWRKGRITIGIVAHGDSTVSGHGPGIVALLTGPIARLCPVLDRNANIAALYQIRPLATPHRRVPLAGSAQSRVRRYNRRRPAVFLDTFRADRHALQV